MPKHRSLKSRRTNKRSTVRHRRHKHVTKKHKVRKHHRHSRSSHKKRHHKVKKVYMKGGYGPGAGPVGYSWTPNNSSWPGVYASNGGNTNGMPFSNHYQYNSSGTGVGGQDPAISTRGDLAEMNYQNGGGIIPQDLINLGRQASYGVSNFLSDLRGSVNPVVNPSVTEDQPINHNVRLIESKIPNIQDFVTASSNDVSNMS